MKYKIVFYFQIRNHLAKAAEKRYSTIPSQKEKVWKFEEEASHNVLRKYFINREDIALIITDEIGSKIMNYIYNMNSN
jgi:hypothetical protein